MIIVKPNIKLKTVYCKSTYTFFKEDRGEMGLKIGAFLKSFFSLSLVISILLVSACSKDDIPDPYQPKALPAITRLNVISGLDSSIYFFNSRTQLSSGRNNSVGYGNSSRESYSIEYSNDLLVGADYENWLGSRTQPRRVTYSRNDRNMLATVSSDEKSDGAFSLSYNDQYLLSQIIYTDAQSTISKYTITYDANANVSVVELHTQGSAVIEKYEKWEYQSYDSHPNPFYFLVNVFYAPVFSSTRGPVLSQTIPLGSLLSVNNPGAFMKYTKSSSSDEYGSGMGYPYTYTYDDNNEYPVEVSVGVNLKFEYFK